MNPLLLDLLVIAIIALFAFFGWRKGLVLTLCGLLAIFVAFFAAVFVSKTLSAPVASLFQPAVQEVIEQGIQNGLDQARDNLSQLPDGLSESISAKLPPAAQITLGQVADLLEQIDLQALLSQMDFGAFTPVFEGLFQNLLQAVQDRTLNAAAAAPAAISTFLCESLSRFLLFYLTFVVVLILWKIFSHALDLACRLPVLHTFNEAGGLLIGLVKGLLIALAAAWLLTSFGFASAEDAGQTYLFQLFLNFQLL